MTTIHSLNHLLRRHSCTSCDKAFKTKRELQTHVSGFHNTSIRVRGHAFSTNADGAFVCPWKNCNLEFSDAKTFRNHNHIRNLTKESSSSGPSILGPSRPESEDEEPEKVDSEKQWEDEAEGHQSTDTNEVNVDINMGSPLNSGSDSPYDPAMDISPPHISAPSNKPVKSLERPPELKQHNLGIDTTHKLIVCEACGYAIMPKALKNHFNHIHHKFDIVKDDLLAVLEHYNISDSPPPTSQAPIIPIQSIPTVTGLQCRMPNCTYVSNSTNEESVRKNHFYKEHPGTSPANMIVQCTVQQVFRHPPVCWQVDPHYNVFGGLTVDLKEMLVKIQQDDAKGLNDGTMHAPENVRLARPFLRTLGWLGITQDADHEALEQLIALPDRKKSPGFAWLHMQTQGYATHTRAINENLNFISRQIINTSKGYALSICSTALSNSLNH